VRTPGGLARRVADLGLGRDRLAMMFCNDAGRASNSPPRLGN
jgi:hypothetical protein